VSVQLELDSRQVAELLDRSIDSVRYLAKRKKLPARQTGTGRYRFQTDVIEQFRANGAEAKAN
jgi:hypothetical protein